MESIWLVFFFFLLPQGRVWISWSFNIQRKFWVNLVSCRRNPWVKGEGMEAVEHQGTVGQIKWGCKLNRSNWGRGVKNSNCKLQSSDLTVFLFFSLPWQLGRTASNGRNPYRPKGREMGVSIAMQITGSFSCWGFFSPNQGAAWVQVHCQWLNINCLGPEAIVCECRILQEEAPKCHVGQSETFVV